jgi:hypothetical protein
VFVWGFVFFVCFCVCVFVCVCVCVCVWGGGAVIRVDLGLLQRSSGS